ncbi:sulfotransferase 1B1-like [Lytechinus pictus]|uniref:sulfotransferase 1B1-like n=1 Tax=Lytechinus pictus TaxID=7653 RepID=UPI0030BA282D
MADSQDSMTSSALKSMAAGLMNTFEYQGILFPAYTTPDTLVGIRNMDVREDDVILTSYIKCGTHWMAEILLLILNSGIPLSSQDRFDRSSQLLELPAWIHNMSKSYEYIATIPSPRMYITHLPIQFLPEQVWKKKPKIVYVARSPRDCLASLFNYLKPDPQQYTWNEIFNLFTLEKMPYGSVWDHQYGFWKRRNDSNILYVDFEDMKMDPAGNAAKVAAHLGYDLSAEQLAEVTRLSSLNEMKSTYARLEDELGDKGKLLTHAAGILPFLHKGIYER